MVILSSTLYALCIETKIFFCKSVQMEDNSYNLPMGQSMFRYELTFWLIAIVNVCKQEDKNTLRADINQFFDG